MDSTEGKTGAMYVGGGAGLAAGAIAGTKIGATVGTAWGPVGTLIGAGAGILLGALTGLAATYIGPLLGFDEEYYQRKATGGLNEKEYTEFAAAAAERGISHNDEEGLRDLYYELGYNSKASWEEVHKKIKGLGDDFDELANSALAMETAQKAYVDSFVTSALTNAGLEENRYADQISEISAESYGDLDERIADKVDDMGKLSNDQKAEYASLTGKSLDQVNKQLKDGEISEDTIKQVIATNEVQQEMQEEMKQTAEAFADITKRAKKMGISVTSLTNILSDEGKDIRQEDLQDFKDAQKGTQYENVDFTEISDPKVQKAMVERYLASKNTSLGELGLDSGDDWRVIWENLNIGADAFAESANAASQWGAQLDKRVSASAASGLAGKLQEQAAQGSAGAGNILNSINSIISNADFSAEEAQQFYEALNSVNWDDSKSIESLSDKLESLGFNMDELGDVINGLETDIKDFANSTYQLTPEEKAELVDKTTQLTNDILYNNKRVFTAEEKGLFSPDMQNDKFIQIGESFYLKDGTITGQQLVDDITQNTRKQTYDPTAENAYNAIEGHKNTTDSITTTDYKYNNTAQDGMMQELYSYENQYNNFDKFGGMSAGVMAEQGKYYDSFFFDGVGTDRDSEETMIAQVKYQGAQNPQALYYLTQIEGMGLDQAINYLSTEKGQTDTAKKMYKWSQGLNRD